MGRLLVQKEGTLSRSGSERIILRGEVVTVRFFSGQGGGSQGEKFGGGGGGGSVKWGTEGGKKKGISGADFCEPVPSELIYWGRSEKKKNQKRGGEKRRGNRQLTEGAPHQPIITKNPLKKRRRKEIPL